MLGLKALFLAVSNGNIKGHSVRFSRNLFLTIDLGPIREGYFLTPAGVLISGTCQPRADTTIILYPLLIGPSPQNPRNYPRIIISTI